MKCPRTGTELKTVRVGGISVDVSERCGGVFFDDNELQKFDELHEIRGEVLAEHLSQFRPPVLDVRERIKCPKCVDVVMMRRYHSPKKILEIDECPKCSGVWLDAGELSTLRATFPSAPEREAFRKQLIAEVEAQPEVVADRRELDQSIARMNALANTLWRLIGPY